MEEMCRGVAALLRQCGVHAYEWDSGGDTWVVAIANPEAPDEPSFCFGTAGPVWAGEITDEAFDQPAGVETTVPASHANQWEIAAAILGALSTLAATRVTQS